ncbi:hypothetical protein AGR4B_pAt20517 [Agrobacterium tumefaciens str. CFBP 5621]|nr:hypothetical protein AGR4B_pAt20517 [Agrobacterium tumefaciens str. CFBP 5621]
METKNPAGDMTSVRRAGFPGEVVSVTVTTPMTPTEINDPPARTMKKVKKEKIVAKGDQGKQCA